MKRKTTTTPTWTKEHFPVEMMGMSPDARTYAIKVANSLVESGFTIDHVVPRAMAAAWSWSHNGEEEVDDVVPGAAHYVHYHQGEWLIETDDETEPSKRFNHLEQALACAYKHVLDTDGAIYVYSRGDLVDRIDPADRDMMATVYFHVAPYNEGWCVSRLGATEGYFKQFSNKKSALAHAREHARNDLAQLMIHNSSNDEQSQVDYRSS